MTTEPQTDESRAQRPALRVYQEDAKTRQTSHWDWDYLPLATLERLARQSQTRPPDAENRRDPLIQRRIALVCIGAGTLLLASLLAVCAFFVQTTV